MQLGRQEYEFWYNFVFSVSSKLLAHVITNYFRTKLGIATDCPPSTGSTTPLRNEARGDTRNITDSATSCASSTRFRGFVSGASARICRMFNSKSGLEIYYHYIQILVDGLTFSSVASSIAAQCLRKSVVTTLGLIGTIKVFVINNFKINKSIN